MSDLSPAKKDVLSRNFAVGREAERVLEATGKLHSEREHQLLDELLTWYASQPWDEKVAIRYVAALNENRTQRQTLEYRARTGAAARAKLFGTKTADG